MQNPQLADNSQPQTDKSSPAFNIATYGVAALAIICMINAVAIITLYYRLRRGGQYLDAVQHRPVSGFQRTAESLSQLSSTVSSASSHVMLNTGGLSSRTEHTFNKPF